MKTAETVEPGPSHPIWITPAWGSAALCKLKIDNDGMDCIPLGVQFFIINFLTEGIYDGY